MTSNYWMVQDVPSPIDLKDSADAAAWAAAAGKRPGRAEMLERFVTELSSDAPASVLELGSGPGFLAEKLLAAFPGARYVALDFSAAMHALARTRLGALASNCEWLERDFRAADWTKGLGKFSAVVTNQAVHELRHKSRAAALHAGVRSLLLDNGVYLMCDHWCGEGGMANAELYLTMDEHFAAFAEAGFADVELLAQIGTLAFFHAK